MKGLVIKELFLVRSSMWVLICFSIIFHSYRLSLLSMLFLVVAVMIVTTTVFDDEKTGWDKYVSFMPLSYTKIILSKYIVGIICGAAIAVVICGVTLIIQYVESPLFAVGGGLLLGLFNLSLYMPLSAKFGSKYVGIVQGGLQIGLVYLLGKAGLTEGLIDMMLGNQFIALVLLLIIVGGMTVVSIKATAKIYENKMR